MSITVPASHAGLDKSSPPSWDETSTLFVSKKHPKVNFDYDWMQKLFSRSNYAFTGLYLSHCTRVGKDDDRTQDPEWRKVFPVFLNQGWGFWFLFVGYSYRQSKRNLTSWNLGWDKLDISFSQNLGKEDARLLKRRAAEVGGYEAQGAVVFIDNEDQNPPHDRPLSKQIVAYYEALIAECRVSGQLPADGPAVRPGFYARSDVMLRVLKESTTRDMWTWVCSPLGETSRPKNAYPEIYDTRTRPGQIICPIRRYALDALQDHKEKRTYMSLGRQWVLWEKDHRCLEAPDIGTQRWLKRCADIDFDAAMVRDPRYPIAEPRIAVMGKVQLRTEYSKKDLSMRIEQIYQVMVPVPVPFDPRNESTELFEPEAPLLITESSLRDYSGPEIYTLNKSGMPVMIAADATSIPEAPYRWRFPRPIINSRVRVRPRRNRAMAVAHTPDLSTGLETTQLFFVAEDHTLLSVRRDQVQWSDPMPVAGQQLLHPFSSIAAVQQGFDSISTFFLDLNGYLCHSSLPGSEKDWPGTDFTQLQTAPTLLPETPLVAVSPSYRQTLVFGIGKDFFIHMAVWTMNDDDRTKTAKTKLKNGGVVTSNGAWTKLARIEGQKDKDYKVFSKAGLEVMVKIETVDIAKIYIASVTEVNIPFVFELKLSGSTWTLQDSEASKKYLPTTDMPLAGKVAPSKAARGWSCNPFGDVKLSLLDGTVAIWIPAVRNKDGQENLTETGILMRKPFLASDSYWIEVEG